MSTHTYIALRKGHPGTVFASAETLESLKQKLNIPDEYAIYELVYTDEVEFAHTVKEVRASTKRRELPL